MYGSNYASRSIIWQTGVLDTAAMFAFRRLRGASVLICGSHLSLRHGASRHARYRQQRETQLARQGP